VGRCASSFFLVAAEKFFSLRMQIRLLSLKLLMFMYTFFSASSRYCVLRFSGIRFWLSVAICFFRSSFESAA